MCTTNVLDMISHKTYLTCLLLAKIHKQKQFLNKINKNILREIIINFVFHIWSFDMYNNLNHNDYIHLFYFIIK